MNDENNTEWPSDPGPAGGYETNPEGAAGAAAGGDPGVTPGSVTPPPAGQPPAGAEPARQPSATEPPEGFIPKYRLDQTTAEVTRLKGVLNQLLTGTKASADPNAPPPDPRNAKIRDKILELVPELKHLSALTQNHTQQQEAETRRQDQFAVRTIQGALTHAAAQMLGEGKTFKDLDRNAQIWLKDSFVSWVLADDERAARYDAGDTNGMAAEFWTSYNQVMRATAIRTQNTAVLDRGARRANLPSQGSSAAPVGQPTPPLNFSDEAAVHKAGWAQVSGG